MSSEILANTIAHAIPRAIVIANGSAEIAATAAAHIARDNAVNGDTLAGRDANEVRDAEIIARDAAKVAYDAAFNAAFNESVRESAEIAARRAAVDTPGSFVFNKDVYDTVYNAIVDGASKAPR
jgi:hypothetical protein